MGYTARLEASLLGQVNFASRTANSFPTGQKQRATVLAASMCWLDRDFSPDLLELERSL